MGDILKVYNLGERGVNVDSDPIVIEDQELRQAQNAIRDPLGVDSGIRKRPGLVKYNENLASGSIIGGIGVPLTDLSSNGNDRVTIYIGRGPS